MVNTELEQAARDAEQAAKRLQVGGMRHKSARADNDRPAAPWYRIQNKADDATVAQIDIYDEIDWFWGISAANFRDDLKALGEDVATIELHINSPGGDVYEAIAIMNTLRQHDAKVVTTVDGMAASSAGFIAVGASDTLIVAENAEVMAHLPWAITIGDAADMRKMADDLDRIGSNIASIFAARAGGTVDEWMSVLTAETWWSAQEAVDAGIADEVLAAPARDAKTVAQNRFDLSVFNHAGRVHAPAPPRAQKTPPPVEAEGTKRKGIAVANLSESALEQLGLDADADEAAIDAAIAALAAPESGGGDPAPAEPSPEQVAAVAAKYGLTVLDKGAHDQLKADAQAGRDARAQQIADQNDATIRDALASGRITPATQDTWRKSLIENRESTVALLATLPQNTALPVDEMGHGVSREARPEDADNASVFAAITGQTYGKDA